MGGLPDYDTAGGQRGEARRMSVSPTTFAAAVAQAKGFIETYRLKNGRDIAISSGYESHLADRVGRLTAYSALFGFDGSILSGESGDFSAERAQAVWDDGVDSLIEGAKYEHSTFQALKLGLAAEIESGREIPPRLRKWLIGYLRGEIEVPAARAGRIKSTGLHSLVAHAVADLVESGMTATRNEASAPESACDAVASALAELGLSPITFAGVKRIWLDWDKAFWI